jgi:large subunit ribosomal protein L25
MVKDIQTSPVKGDMLHVDFQQVSLNEEIRADLTIILKGADTLEFKKLMPLRQLDVIAVKGFPQDIPDDITIDVSNIDKVENVYLKDINFPEGIVPEADPEQIVISIVETKRAVADSEEEDEDKSEAEEEDLI